MPDVSGLTRGQILTGSLFSEPVSTTTRQALHDHLMGAGELLR